MPILRRVRPLEDVQPDPVELFSGLSDDGLDDIFDGPHYHTREAAQRAWRRVRRPVWARTSRFRVPGAATVYDGLSIDRREFVLWLSAAHIPPFDLAGALEALEATTGQPRRV